jgi:hypothetical protein
MQGGSNLNAASIKTFTVATSQSIGQGIPFLVDNDGLATPVTTSAGKATWVAYATEDGTWPATAGDKVTAVKIGSPAEVLIKVGTGGATVGEYGVATTDGVTDGTVGGGTTLLVPICEWQETGVAGDLRKGWLGVSRTVGA